MHPMEMFGDDWQLGGEWGIEPPDDSAKPKRDQKTP